MPYLSSEIFSSLLECQKRHSKRTSEFSSWILPVVLDSEVTLITVSELQRLLISVESDGKMIMNGAQVRISNLHEGSLGI